MTRTTALVFAPGSSAPIYRIERAEARQLVWEGHAEWKNRCNDIVLLKAHCDIRGNSCLGKLHSALVAACYRLPELDALA